MARVVPHVFREEVLADRFEWAVIGFNKEPTNGLIDFRQAAFRETLDTWRKAYPAMEPWEALQTWTAANLRPANRKTPDGNINRWPGPNFASSQFPRLWLHSPIQVANEIDKTVGFPILSPRYREAYRRLGIDSQITDPDLRAAITRA